MGCDIHLFLQTKKKSSDAWVITEEIDLGRDYDLFGILSGVRTNHYRPIVSSGHMETVDVQRREFTLQVPTEFGKDTIFRAGIPYGEDGHVYVGDHSFHTLTLTDLLSYRHYNKIDSPIPFAEDDERSHLCNTLGRLIIKLLANTNRVTEARYIVGYDS